MYQISEVIRQLERVLAGSDYKGTDKEYPYIPYNTDDFVKLLTTAYGVYLGGPGRPRSRSPRFLDVGCGIGTKVLVAEQVLHLVDVFGLEKHPPYCEVARKMVGPGRIIQADGITYKEYKRFDIVYFYRPLHDPDGQAALENAIVQQLAPNAVICSPLHTTLNNQKSLTPVGHNVYIKRARKYTSLSSRKCGKANAGG